MIALTGALNAAEIEANCMDLGQLQIWSEVNIERQWNTVVGCEIVVSGSAAPVEKNLRGRPSTDVNARGSDMNCVDLDTLHTFDPRVR